MHLRERKTVDHDKVWLAERIRRAGACMEMAEVLRNLGRHSNIPDIQWMAHAAAEELAETARSYNHPARASEAA